ncbi:protein C19orf12 homolog [Galleria mellonella]|uniref:Protein C19orf12 homolog n=1 Tax=Galleria mellonella TaxID=7137 RepID=A0A6J1WRE2_GALME|nr:protein C19orf12 homolog [Galleria mellonella]
MEIALQEQSYVGHELGFNSNWIEQILLELADHFDIRIVWDKDTAVVTAVCTLAGGVIGGYAGGRLGAALGAGIGGATGLGVYTLVSLREIWETVKEKLKELLYIVYNYLRRLDPVDYVRAFEILMACTSSRRELVITILDFITDKLGREVISSITAA